MDKSWSKGIWTAGDYLSQLCWQCTTHNFQTISSFRRIRNETDV